MIDSLAACSFVFLQPNICLMDWSKPWSAWWCAPEAGGAEPRAPPAWPEASPSDLSSCLKILQQLCSSTGTQSGHLFTIPLYFPKKAWTLSKTPFCLRKRGMR